MAQYFIVNSFAVGKLTELTDLGRAKHSKDPSVLFSSYRKQGGTFFNDLLQESLIS